MPVADTSFIIDLIRHDPHAMACLKDIEDRGISPSMTPISILELYYGAYNSVSVEENIKEALMFRNLWEELPFTDEVYHTFGYLSATLLQQGVRIGDFDEVIAAFALTHDSMVIARDRHFEKVPGLKIISY